MDLVKPLLASLLALTLPAVARAEEPWAAEVHQAAARVGLPEPLIRAVLRAESRGDPRAVSRAGAMGLMQLMPGTWAAMRQRLALGADPDDPRNNILAGTLYLRLMYDRFGYPGLFAAYNAGPERYAAHLATGSALPGETVAYLETVAGVRSAGPVPAGKGPRERLFAVRYAAPSPSATAALRPAAASLFAVRHEGR